MKIGDNLKKLRESNGLTQQQMADLIHTHRSGYSKIENNQQDVSIEALMQLSKQFNMSVDEIISYNNNKIPNEVSVADKATIEQLQLINELEPEEKTLLLKLIETFVSKKRFKDFVQQNIATL